MPDKELKVTVFAFRTLHCVGPNYETIGRTLVGKEDLLETMALERECEQLDLEIAESVYEEERRYHLQSEEWSINELIG